MPGGPLPGTLAARLRVSRMRAQTLLPAALPQCLPMHPLPASGLADGRHRLREHQAAADEMVSRHVSADPVEERSLGDGLGASVGSQLQHGLVAEAQADAGDEGTGRERPAGPHRAGGRCLPGGRNPRRQTRTRGAGQDAVRGGRAGHRRRPAGGVADELRERVPQAGDCGLGPPASAAGDGGLLGRTGLLPGSGGSGL